MTVRVLGYRGDGSYFLRDGALELAELRHGAVARVLAGGGTDTVSGRLDRLLEAPLRGGRRAFDVVVAAPKQVSVLLAIEERRTARSVVSVHERAVDAVVDYLCAEGIRTARGVATPVAVGFTHGVNRLLDPHLHTHVLVGARDADGTPLVARELHRHAAAADALYLAALRDELPDATGRRAWAGASGGVRVEGVDPGLCAATSVARGRDGRWQREAVKVLPTAAEARRHWDAAIAAALRFDPPAVPARPRDVLDEHRFAAALGDGAVGRPGVVAAWASACTFGAPPDQVRAAVAVVVPGLDRDGALPAIALREAASVQVLGPRPLDPPALATWLAGRDEVARFLAEGHRLGDLVAPRCRSADSLLAVARLDAALRRRGLERHGPGSLTADRARILGRSTTAQRASGRGAPR